MVKRKKPALCALFVKFLNAWENVLRIMILKKITETKTIIKIDE